MGSRNNKTVNSNVPINNWSTSYDAESTRCRKTFHFFPLNNLHNDARAYTCKLYNLLIIMQCMNSWLGVECLDRVLLRQSQYPFLPRSIHVEAIDM